MTLRQNAANRKMPRFYWVFIRTLVSDARPIGAYIFALKQLDRTVLTNGRSGHRPPRLGWNGDGVANNLRLIQERLHKSIIVEKLAQAAAISPPALKKFAPGPTGSLKWTSTA